MLGQGSSQLGSSRVSAQRYVSHISAQRQVRAAADSSSEHNQLKAMS
jgi:hypothetical protein